MFCGLAKVIRLTTYFWEILHSAPTFEVGPSSELNKGEMGELQDEDEELDKKRWGGGGGTGEKRQSTADPTGSL